MSSGYNILTFNWHEGYLYTLSRIGHHFDIVPRLKGGYSDWMYQFRPLPANASLVTEDMARANLKADKYDCVICHNLLDIFDVSSFNVPKILIFHTKPSALFTPEGLPVNKSLFISDLKKLTCSSDRLLIVFVSEAKKQAWGIDGTVIPIGIDINDYKTYRGDLESVLRVGHFLKAKDTHYFDLKKIEFLLKDIPVSTLGINPDISEATLSRDWDDLKEHYAAHRLYFNTLYEELDDGYNISMVEAMATGMPIVSVENSTSPIKDSVNGFISNDMGYLRKRINELLNNPSLAREIGAVARETASRMFKLDDFIDRWHRAIETVTVKRPGSKLLGSGLAEKNSMSVSTPDNNTSAASAVNVSISRNSTFDNNIKILREKQPDLAEILSRTVPSSEYKILDTKNGEKTLRINNTTLHSLYDPSGEAELWLTSYQNITPNTSVLVVLGFGLAYHIEKLCGATDKEIIVMEPDLKTLRIALSVRDLQHVLKRISIITDYSLPFIKQRFTTLEFLPSVKLHPQYFEFVKSRLQLNRRMQRGLKIMVVGPIYGGSLPIAQFCVEALGNLGHKVDYVDNSIYKDAYLSITKITSNRRVQDLLRASFINFASEAVLARCEEFQPDILFALAQAPINETTLLKLKSTGVPTAFWFVEDYKLMTYWEQIAHLYDYFFTIQKGEFFSALKARGIKNVHYLPLASSPSVHKPLNLSEEERNLYGSDISFVGAGYYNRRCLFEGLLDFDFKIWGNEWDMSSSLGKFIQLEGRRVDTEEIVKIFNASKININLHSSPYHKGVNPDGDFVNPRTFEIAACGGFQLVDQRSLLPELFEIDKEIICFTGLEDLRAKIRFYLSRPEERQEIAQRARERVLKEHTYELRMQEMLSFIYENGIELPAWSTSRQSIDTMIEEAGEDTELRAYLSQFYDKGSIDLDDIIENIQSGEGSLSRVEKIFLLMNQMKDVYLQK